MASRHEHNDKIACAVQEGVGAALRGRAHGQTVG